MQYNLLTINNETVLPITLFGGNRDSEILEYHKKVMVGKFLIPVNYINCPFPSVSHGYCVNHIIKETITSIKPDYYWFIDNDSIILRKEYINIMYDTVKYKNAIISQATQSNHKLGPDNFLSHAYASQAFVAFSRELYENLGRPCMDHWSEKSHEFGGDTCERLTYAAKKAGYIVSLIYPSYSIDPNTKLDNGMRFGRGNYYGPNLTYHQMQNNYPNSTNEFIDVCKRVLDGKFE